MNDAFSEKVVESDSEAPPFVPDVYREVFKDVTALQLRWDTWNEMCEFVGVGDIDDDKPTGIMMHNNAIGLLIPERMMAGSTHRYGVLLVKENSWVIKQRNGELFVQTDEAFKETFRIVKDPSQE